MPTSQNGYTVVDREDCKFYDNIVHGLNLPLRKGAAGYVLARFLVRFNAEVENLGRTDTFGHAKRQISGSDEWSNHASGTAVDCNSTKHPYGSRDTFSAQQVNVIRSLLADFDDVLRWGGDYRYTKDEMHFEIDKPFAEVRRLAAVLRQNNTVSLDKLSPGKRNVHVYMVKKALNKRGLYNGNMSYYFGKGLRRAYSNWQEDLGYVGKGADGIPGRASLEALGFEVRA